MQELCQRLEQHYDEIHLNVPIYSKRNRLVAEIDILAKRKDTYDVFEVKCSHRIVKAKKQLLRIRKHLEKNEVTDSSNLGRLFFFCGVTGELIVM